MDFDKKSCSDCDVNIHELLMKKIEGSFYCPDCKQPSWAEIKQKLAD